MHLEDLEHLQDRKYMWWEIIFIHNIQEMEYNPSCTALCFNKVIKWHHNWLNYFLCWIETWVEWKIFNLKPFNALLSQHKQDGDKKKINRLSRVTV